MIWSLTVKDSSTRADLQIQYREDHFYEFRGYTKLEVVYLRFIGS
jgi:hypothetical protein